jgi:hypothetical protein
MENNSFVGSSLKRIVLVLVTVAATTSVVVFAAFASEQNEDEAAAIYGIRIPSEDRDFVFTRYAP